MIEDDEDFVVRDAKSGVDITASVLKQVISERPRHG
jgi:polyhydroxyalkanoate synthesis regulator protein